MFISSVKFWLKQNINLNLKKVVENENQLIFRWGDLPIIGSFLNIYLKKEQFGYFMNTAYRHESHNQIVKSKQNLRFGKVKKNLHFVYCFDDGYNRQGLSIFSLLENIDGDDINIIHSSSNLKN